MTTAVREGAEVEFCSNCDGVWFDQHELVQYLEAMARTDADQKQTDRPSTPHESSKRSFCPKCNQIFTRKTIGTSNVRVLRCVSCRGLWIQKEQLNQLVSWYRTATPAEQLLAEDFKEKEDEKMLSMGGGFLPGLVGLVIDENPIATFPWLIVTLILANVGVFVWFVLHPEGMGSYMLTPAKLMRSPFSTSYTLITSIFLHASIFHLLGNMYFLLIFGDNVAERIGVVTFIVFYLATGIVANLLHILITNHPEIPALGASGAVSGVMGGYRVLYPQTTIRCHGMKYGIPFVIRWPAYLYFAIWFLIQLLMSLVFGVRGVAWDVHISGFVFGLVCMYIMKRLEAL